MGVAKEVQQSHSARNWSTRRDAKSSKLAAVAAYARGKLLEPASIVKVLEALIHPGDRVAL